MENSVSRWYKRSSSPFPGVGALSSNFQRIIFGIHLPQDGPPHLLKHPLRLDRHLDDEVLQYNPRLSVTIPIIYEVLRKGTEILLNLLFRRLQRRKGPGQGNATSLAHPSERTTTKYLTAPEPSQDLRTRRSNEPQIQPRSPQRAFRTPKASTQATNSHPLIKDHWFGSIQVSAPIATALREIGYLKPTPIQEEAIPSFLDGFDLVGQAMTGTGKTAAFGIPLAELINPNDMSVQAIVLVPTRELVVQVSAELCRISNLRGIRVVPIYGGQSIQHQIQALKRGVHMVVGTPGRVMDHQRRGTLRLNRVRFAVLDEADEMLDIGFADDIDRILSRTPSQRQTALYSATFPSFIRRLIHRHLRDPVWVRLGGEIEMVDEVEQVYYEIAERDSGVGLREILDRQVNGGQALIFCRTQVNVDRLVGYLARHHYPVYGLHGGKPQRERNAIMQAFRDGSKKLLVSTNLASRGIDIPTITHVINYNIPDNLEEYVHRIGRAGRMGRPGTAITLVREWDFDVLDSIMGYVGDRLLQGKLTVSP